MVGIFVMKQYYIRTASLFDLKELARLEKTCFGDDRWPLFDLVLVLTSAGIVRLKAVDSEQNLLGFIAGDIHQSPHIGWIITLGVNPAFRRLGIASALLKQCEDELKRRKFRLTVRVDNQTAINLYHKHGYQPIDMWKDYYQKGVDALVLEKQLDHPVIDFRPEKV